MKGQKKTGYSQVICLMWTAILFLTIQTIVVAQTSAEKAICKPPCSPPVGATTTDGYGRPTPEKTLETPNVPTPPDTAVVPNAPQCKAVLTLDTPTVNPSTKCTFPIKSISNDAPAEFPLGTTEVNWTFTNIYDRSTTVTQNVSVVSDLAVAATPSDPLCNGNSDGQIEASASGGSGAIDYMWSDGQTTQIATGLMSGNYQVVVTDGNGCKDSVMATLADPPVLLASAASSSNYNGSPISCAGESDGEITITASGGTGPLQYSLDSSPLQGSPVFFGLMEGTYTAMVQDANGCMESSPVTLSEPAVVDLTAAQTSPVSTCGGADGTAMATASGGTPPFNYLWTDPLSTMGPVVTNLMAGFYNVTATDANGCFVTTTVEITQGEPEICGNGLDDDCDGLIDEDCGLVLEVKLFIQGYYIGGSMQQPVLLNQFVPGATGLETDTIHVELRGMIDPSVVEAETDAILNTNGFAECNFSTGVPGSYWIAVRHRNSIETWSSVPVNLVAGPNSYDFSMAQSQAFANNQIDVYNENIWSIYNSDVNQDGFIDIFDFPPFDFDNQNFVFGVYANTDFNGDGFVDIFDFPIFDFNNQNFIFSIHP